MANPSYTTRSVLLIEDDRQLRTLLVSYLESLGWRTLEAENGEAGLELAKKHRPHAVICDLLLPRTNGFQICVALRKDLGLLTTSIVAISGRSYACNRQLALESGADEFLLKPVHLSELAAVLDRLREGMIDDAPISSSNPESTRIKFWGVRGSTPVPGPSTVLCGGNTSCVEVRAGSELIILDCGSGARPLGRALAQEFDDRPLALTLLLTHTHWDHIQGFPFFLPAFQAKNRIQILGYDSAGATLSRVLAGQMESPYFPIGLRELPANIRIKPLKDLEFQVGEVSITAAFTNHPGICMGYRLKTNAGSFIYMPDHEPFSRASRRIESQSSPSPEELAFVEEEEKKLLDFVRDVDLMIMDAQYDNDEYPDHVGWGHGNLDEVVRVALRANVKQLMLFHHDPNHDDEKIARMTEHARKVAAAASSHLVIDAAREGAEVLLSTGQPDGTPHPAPTPRSSDTVHLH